MAATSTPAPPLLSVTPLAISIKGCVLGQAQMTIWNKGGTSLHWSAAPSNTLYLLSASNGTLAANQSQTVTISDITLSGTVTVTAPGAQMSPQKVVITCR
jgi:hypothetical protein